MILAIYVATFAWIAIGSSAVIALALAVGGAISVLPRARFLQRRLELYPDLPVVRVIEDTRVRLDALAPKIANVSLLLDRARVALAEIQAGVERFAAIAMVVGNAFGRARTAVSWVMRVFGWSSKAMRTPGS